MYLNAFDNGVNPAGGDEKACCTWLTSVTPRRGGRFKKYRSRPFDVKAVAMFSRVETDVCNSDHLVGMGA